MLMLIFYVGNDCYCCSCDSMIEIVPAIPLKKIPQAPSYVQGLLNYGGEPILVLDLSSIIAGHPSKDSMHTRIMILKNPEDRPIKILGLMAEKIIETRDLTPGLFTEPGLLIKNLSFLDGVYITEQESIQKVNVDQFFKTYG